jgi:hypothetical protein
MAGSGAGGASFDDKLAARRAARARQPAQAEGAGGRAAGGAARGGRSAAIALNRGRSAAIALNRLISQEEDAKALLRLVAEELHNFNDVNVATAFNRLGKLCRSRSFPRNITADDSFRGLMVSLRDMCDDRRLQARVFANVVHAVSKMSAAGKLATDDAGVQDTLEALEQQVERVALDMNPRDLSNTVYGFALLRASLEDAVVRVAPDPDMDPQAVSTIMWVLATRGWIPGAQAWAALEVAVVRVGPGMGPEELSNIAWSFATLGRVPGSQAWAALEA